jgi:RNA polymerase sigma-70 factor (ECF subfamily)
MAFERFRQKIKAAQQAEATLEAELIFALPEQLTLEERTTQLFEMLREPVYYYLLVVLGNPEEAEDITQDAFLQLYKTLRSGQTIQQVRFWLFRVAHNLALNRMRQHDVRSVTQTWDDIAAQWPDPAPSPEQAIIAREEFRRIHATFALLSPQEKQCLQLRVEGFRYREIAEILHVSLPSVAEYVRRAIQKLSRQ